MGGTRQCIVGGINDALNNVANTIEYSSIMGGTAWDATESVVYQILPDVGTFMNLRIWLSTAPDDTTDGYTFYLRVNGIDSMPITLTGATTTGVDTSTRTTCIAGQTISLKCLTSAAGPSAIPTVRWAIDYYSNTANYSIYLGCSSDLPTVNQAEYNDPVCVGNPSWSTGQNNRTPPCGISGTLRNLYIQLGADPVGVVTFTLQVGSTVKVTTTFASGQTTQNSGADSGSITAGNNLSLKVLFAASTTSSAVAWGFVIVATTLGDFTIMGQTTGTVNNSNTFTYPSSWATGWNTTEVNRQQLTNAFTLTAFYVYAVTGAAASASHTFSVNDDGTQVTGCTVTLGVGVTTGNITGLTGAVAAGSLLSIYHTYTGTPGTTLTGFGIACSNTDVLPSASKHMNLIPKTYIPLIGFRYRLHKELVI